MAASALVSIKDTQGMIDLVLGTRAIVTEDIPAFQYPSSGLCDCRSMDALRSLAGSLQRQAVHACRLLEAVDELDRLLTPDPRRPPVLGESAAAVAREAVTELGGGPHRGETGASDGD
jgi:hypothetical protein